MPGPDPAADRRPRRRLLDDVDTTQPSVGALSDDPDRNEAVTTVRAESRPTPPVQVASSERDLRFLNASARCAAAWALTLTAMIPALSGAVRRADGSWMAVGIVLLSLALGLIPGSLFASSLAEVLHPQTLIMATAAVAAACWALAATGPSWPLLAVVSMLGGAAASTFGADTYHYWRALGADDPRGPNLASLTYLAAAVGVLFGLAVSVLIGPQVVEAVSAASMALLCLVALVLPSLRHHPFEATATGPLPR